MFRVVLKRLGWWCISSMLAFKRLSQKNCEFKASLGKSQKTKKYENKNGFRVSMEVFILNSSSNPSFSATQ
jgi:hypothetical protein